MKTDKEDIKRLLKLLVGGIVPEVWVPPLEVRELRAFTSYRARLVKTSTMIRNRLQSLLHKHNLMLSEAGLLEQAWWDEQKNISTLEKIQIRQELVLLQEVEKLKVAVDEELQRQSTSAMWGKPALQIMQLPGVGFVVAMTVLAAIADISRFEHASKLVGYAGLGAGVHDSGKTHKEKKITKKGRRELRWATLAPHGVRCSAGVIGVTPTPFYSISFSTSSIPNWVPAVLGAFNYSCLYRCFKKAVSTFINSLNLSNRIRCPTSGTFLI